MPMGTRKDRLLPRHMPQGKRMVPSDHENAQDSRYLKRRREATELTEAIREDPEEIGKWTDGYY